MQSFFVIVAVFCTKWFSI